MLMAMMGLDMPKILSDAACGAPSNSLLAGKQPAATEAGGSDPDGDARSAARCGSVVIRTTAPDQYVRDATSDRCRERFAERRPALPWARVRVD